MSKWGLGLLVVGGILGAGGAFQMARGATQGERITVSTDQIARGDLPPQSFVEVCGRPSGRTLVSTSVSRRTGEERSRVVYAPLLPEQSASQTVVVVVRTTGDSLRTAGATGCFTGLLSAGIPDNVSTYLRDTMRLTVSDRVHELRLGETPEGQVATGIFGLGAAVVMMPLGWWLRRRSRAKAVATTP